MKLGELAKKDGKDVQKLKEGNFLLFLNRRQTAFKMLGASNVLIHYRSPQQRRVDYRTIQYLPHAFNGAEFSYDRALEMVLTKFLSRKG